MRKAVFERTGSCCEAEHTNSPPRHAPAAGPSPVLAPRARNSWAAGRLFGFVVRVAVGWVVFLLFWFWFGRGDTEIKTR